MSKRTKLVGNTNKVSGAAPRFIWREVDATADEGLWDIIATGDDLLFRTRTDADAAGETWLTIARTAGAVDSVAHAIAGTTVFTTDAGGITLGTDRAIDGTTSVINQIGGTTVGTWTSTGLALTKTGGDITFSAVTTTNGAVRPVFQGFNAGTNKADGSGGGVEIRMRNQATGDNVYTSIGNRDSSGTVNSLIAFVNDGQANHEGSIHVMVCNAGGSLARHWLFKGGGSFMAETTDGPILQDETSSTTNPTLVPDRSEVGTGIGGTSNNLSLIAQGTEAVNITSTNSTFSGYIGLKITDSDSATEGELWYDASEDKLKFRTAAGVETITSS
jgi:hypothetical protein